MSLSLPEKYFFNAYELSEIWHSWVGELKPTLSSHYISAYSIALSM